MGLWSRVRRSKCETHLICGFWTDLTGASQTMWKIGGIFIVFDTAEWESKVDVASESPTRDTTSLEITKPVKIVHLLHADTLQWLQFFRQQPLVKSLRMKCYSFKYVFPFSANLIAKTEQHTHFGKEMCRVTVREHQGRFSLRRGCSFGPFWRRKRRWGTLLRGRRRGTGRQGDRRREGT